MTQQATKVNAGHFRTTVGGFEVTVLLDGYADLPVEVFGGGDAEGARRLLGESFLPLDRFRAPLTAYLVDTGRRLVMIDAGTADLYGPTGGRLPESMREVGVTPEDIDLVLVTHMHSDHFAGLVAGGRIAFPNAEVAIHGADVRYHTDPEAAAAAPEGQRAMFAAARKTAELYPGLRCLEGDGEEAVSGISAIALPGHTPGHTGYMISSEGERLFVTGDLFISPAFHFRYPDYPFALEVDGEQTRRTRRRVLERAAEERLLLAGSHLPFPGLGHVARAGDAYAWVPADWRYDL